jgi:hypothetical protein
VLRDDAIDDCVELCLGAAELDYAGDGQVEEGLQPGEGDDEVVEAHDDVDFVVDAADVVVDVGVEEGAGYDFEGQGHRCGGDVEGLAGLDFFCCRSGRGNDLAGVGGDALAVKGGRHDAALAHVEGLFGGDEAFAEGELHALDGALLGEAGALGDEDFADIVGLVDEHDGGVEDAVAGHIAVGLPQVFKEEDGAAHLYPRL